MVNRAEWVIGKWTRMEGGKTAQDWGEKELEEELEEEEEEE